ncbi:hypothetical protein OC834_003590 [Tilletia horrida]|nr:hypothetical protein OC834_003590 [Tilletia horrida]
MPPPKVKSDDAAAAEKKSKKNAAAEAPAGAAAGPKLTKAQQKALKFKDKSKKKGAKHVPDGGDLPEGDDDESKVEDDAGDIFGVSAAGSKTEAADKARKTKGKSKQLDGEAVAELPASEGKAGKKRKREVDAQAEEQGDGEESGGADEASKAGANETNANGEAEAGAAPKKKRRRKSKAAAEDAGKPRLIVFVGNMSFKVTSKQLAAHFGETCGETPSVRLLTRKIEPAEPAKLSASKLKSIAKGKASAPKAAGAAGGDDESDPVLMGKDGKPLSRGCAFLEFTTAQALQKALRFHHTQFGGRQINVELTAGGGGKSAGRTEKIKAKNSELETERAKLHEKYIAPAAASKKASAAERGGGSKEGVAQWGPRSGKGVTSGTSSAPGKGKKWQPSGANATRLTAS